MRFTHNAKLEGSTSPPIAIQSRRYDVDWLRVLALGLLIVYHIVLCFQPWATSVRFPQNASSLVELWPLMAMINIWRIPLLFLISGMGVRFAMERRDWKQLVKDRSIRVLVPWIFGLFILGPIFGIIMPKLGWRAEYTLQFGHLWFLINIYCYVLWLIGFLIYLKNNPENPVLRFLSRIIRWPMGLFLLALPVVLEGLLVNPQHYSLFVDSAHGWLLGLICFSMGFVLISIQDVFWPAVVRIRWVALIIAGSLYLVRLLVFDLEGSPNGLTAFESVSWMFAILGFGALYLNRPSGSLNYFTKAVYPVYIVHLPVQFVTAYFLLPLSLSASWKLVLMVTGTFGTSLLIYELILRRVKWIRPLFGMKLNRARSISR